MNYGKYQNIAEYMQGCMKDCAHDVNHVYRVVNYALQILETEEAADRNVVIIASFLHDIGYSDQQNGASKCHSKAGSEKSYAYLKENGYTEEIAKHVSDCILTHSIHSETAPQTLEAKIVFDADKLDLAGTVGVARAVLSCGAAGEPMYSLDEDGLPTEGKKKEAASLFREYRQKLRKLTKVFYTEKAQKIGAKHQKNMDDYFRRLIREIEKNHESGYRLIGKYCRAK